MEDNKGKTILFLCRCGPNMAESLDFESLGEWGSKSEDVFRVVTHDLLCSPQGKQAFKQAITDNRADSIVVAGCSPKMHEKTFQALAGECGYNVSQVQMANIREQCAWVTKDKNEAELKAKALISASIRRAQKAEGLEKRSMEVLTDILIIGGGLAGIEAAITAADAGRKVYLVDRDISLGGSVIKYEEVAPNMECGPCVIAPRLSMVKDHPNIEVLTNSEVKDVLGFFGNFKARINTRARFVEESCIGCEMCYEACPVELDSPFHLGLGKWKAIHCLFQGSVPAAAVIDKERCRHFTDGDCSACVELCAFESINFEQQDQEREIEVGAVVLATGFKPHDITSIERLGHGKLEDVYSLSEFERLVSSNGPTGGELKCADGRDPARVAVVHCAGSLCRDGLGYCSGVCCAAAVKVGEMLHKKLPDTEVTNIHNDLVMNGPLDGKFLEKSKSLGVRFVRCGRLDTVRVSRQGRELIVSAEGLEPIKAELVILANGMEPAGGTAELAEMLHLELGEGGFFKAGHDLLHATQASLDGVYLAGCAAGPCNLATSVTRGRAAVADALSKLMPGREIELEMMTSSISDEICAGCKLCMTVCPYKAIIYDEEKKVCQVIEAICRGCGTCTASCPSGASKAKHFTDEQIFAEIGGLLNG